jgi:hypothetical protein
MRENMRGYRRKTVNLHVELVSDVAQNLPNLRLSIPQAGAAPTALTPMQFAGGGLHRLLHAIVDANPGHGSAHMAKGDLSNAYMRIWLRIAAPPKLAFVVPPHPIDPKPLIGFHLSLPMGFVKSAPYYRFST